MRKAPPTQPLFECPTKMPPSKRPAALCEQDGPVHPPPSECPLGYTPSTWKVPPSEEVEMDEGIKRVNQLKAGAGA